jgi:predicted DCC family thiol-disulfide oxidoreductase YuxK
MSSKPILLLFDGECGFCLWCVQFVLSHEREPRVKFAPLQSELGQWLAPEHQQLDTLVVINGNQCLVYSEALIALAQVLVRPWCYLSILAFLPGWVRDGLYRILGKSRYLCFGSRFKCSVPTQLPPDRAATMQERCLWALES